MNYRLNEEKMFMDLSDGLAIVINSHSGIYYGFNEFGSLVFDALTKGMSEENVLQSICGMDSAPDDVQQRLAAFIDELKRFELIVPGNADVNVELDGSVAQMNGFVLEVAAYDDIQEMLLADPVHEVKEETGWTPYADSIGYTKEETREREKKVHG